MGRVCGLITFRGIVGLVDFSCFSDLSCVFFMVGFFLSGSVCVWLVFCVFILWGVFVVVVCFLGFSFSALGLLGFCSWWSLLFEL